MKLDNLNQLNGIAKMCISISLLLIILIYF